LRQHYDAFRRRDAEIVAVAADTLGNARTYFQKHRLPFPCLVDNDHTAYDMYNVQSRLVSLGQRPGLFIIDKEGIVRYTHVGNQQWNIPAVADVLARLDAIG